MKSIIEVFGKEILKEDGSLNRKKLGEIIYKNKKALENLNKLTFKYVVEEILERLRKLEKQGKEIVGIDAPLLYEARLDEHCNYTIAVIAEENIKLDRVCKRDNISKETAMQRLKIQKSDKFFKEKADFVIENNSDNTEELKEVISKILSNLKI